MNVGDWVFFKTRNWPKDASITQCDFSTGETRDLTGQGLYQGRGKVIGIAGGNITVREEKTNRLVDVRPMQMFVETVNLNGDEVPRFQCVEATEDQGEIADAS